MQPSFRLFSATIVFLMLNCKPEPTSFLKDNGTGFSNETENECPTVVKLEQPSDPCTTRIKKTVELEAEFEAVDAELEAVTKMVSEYSAVSSRVRSLKELLDSAAARDQTYCVGKSKLGRVCVNKDNDLLNKQHGFIGIALKTIRGGLPCSHYISAVSYLMSGNERDLDSALAGSFTQMTNQPIVPWDKTKTAKNIGKKCAVKLIGSIEATSHLTEKMANYKGMFSCLNVSPAQILVGSSLAMVEAVMEDAQCSGRGKRDISRTEWCSDLGNQAARAKRLYDRNAKTLAEMESVYKPYLARLPMVQRERERLKAALTAADAEAQSCLDNSAMKEFDPGPDPNMQDTENFCRYRGKRCGIHTTNSGTKDCGGCQFGFICPGISYKYGTALKPFGPKARQEAHNDLEALGILDQRERSSWIDRFGICTVKEVLLNEPLAKDGSLQHECMMFADCVNDSTANYTFGAQHDIYAPKKTYWFNEFACYYWRERKDIHNGGYVVERSLEKVKDLYQQCKSTYPDFNWQKPAAWKSVPWD